MSTVQLHRILQLLAFAIWFGVPALLISYVHRFRLFTGAASFLVLGAAYFSFISPQSLPFGHLSAWLVIGWLHSFAYAGLIARIQHRFRRADALAANDTNA